MVILFLFLFNNIFNANNVCLNCIPQKTLETFQYNDKKFFGDDYLTITNASTVTTTFKIVSSQGVSGRINIYDNNVKLFLGMETLFIGKELYYFGFRFKIKSFFNSKCFPKNYF